MHVKIKIVISIIILIMIVCLLLKFSNKNNYHSFTNLNLNNVDNLMIVAHPDDESIWGGAHLLKDDYLVVCVTCGVRHKRVLEFKKVLNITNDQYIMLGYPDKINGIRDNWEKDSENIQNDLQKIIKLKKWKLIVTHNPDGEYGHIQHIKINQIVTNIYQKIKRTTSQLYYFGKYYRPKELPKYVNNLVQNDQKLQKIKENKLIEIYETQSFIKQRFCHMFPYENWVPYNKWNKV